MLLGALLAVCTPSGIKQAQAQAEPKPPATYPELPTEIPATFESRKDRFDHTRREIEIPMRDGVKLHTVVLLPKGASNAPILLTRTPYNADELTSHAESAHLGSVLKGYDNALEAPIAVRGEPAVNLIASTSGTDSDWVVKLIDVYPNEVADNPPHGGYQLMVAADIFRGRYRENLEQPKPIPANQPLPYRFNLPTANHVFLPGHRIMVQIQSSWFPLYDRNPQTFVPNIFYAKPDDYRKAVQRVYHPPARQASLNCRSPRRSEVSPRAAFFR
jgi:predicted acyl esterase